MHAGGPHLHVETRQVVHRSLGIENVLRNQRKCAPVEVSTQPNNAISAQGHSTCLQMRRTVPCNREQSSCIN